MLHTLTHRLMNAKLLGAVAALSVSGTALTANAAPGHTSVFVSGSVIVGDRCAPPPCRPVIVSRPVVVQRPVVVERPVVIQRPVYRYDDCAQREYDRGFNRGEARGSNVGYREGFNGERFCDTPRDELCDNTRAYRDGYLAAFGKAYHCAFEAGRSDHARACKPRYDWDYRRDYNRDRDDYHASARDYDHGSGRDYDRHYDRD